MKEPVVVPAPEERLNFAGVFDDAVNTPISSPELHLAEVPEMDVFVPPVIEEPAPSTSIEGYAPISVTVFPSATEVSGSVSSLLHAESIIAAAAIMKNIFLFMSICLL